MTALRSAAMVRCIGKPACLSVGCPSFGGQRTVCCSRKRNTEISSCAPQKTEFTRVASLRARSLALRHGAAPRVTIAQAPALRPVPPTLARSTGRIDNHSSLHGCAVARISKTVANPSFQCAVKRRCLPAGANPARQLSLQPVAIGATVEVTNPLKPSV